MNFNEDEESGLPSLGKEPLSDRLRRFALAFLISIGIVAAFVGLVILVIALALPWMREQGEGEEPTDVVIPQSEALLPED